MRHQPILSKPMDILFEVIGWTGTVAILLGYLLLSIGKIENGPLYQWFNLVGASALLVYGAFHSAWASAILNLVWSAIAVFALVQIVRRRRAPDAAAAPSAEGSDA